MRNFLPRYAHKAAVLRFVASVALEEQGIDFSVLQQKYGILGRYFLLPNQFWAHKNHRVVIKALSILKTAGKNIHVYTTGGTGDHRNPDFFKTLINYTDKCDVKDCFHILGIVPFADLASLMRNTVAFINPSKFEGWSTSVEESKSLGKSIILSDIPVHREQAPEWGTYFPPSDAESLANVMSSLWQSYDPDVDSDHQRRAAQRFPMRQMEFAKTFEEIVSEVRPA
jgi:glycosyltransferase involved in cell wall biosynthesis